MRENPSEIQVVLLDVYETMLDMSEVEKRVNTLLDRRSGYLIWMELFMQYCFVDNCTVQFNDFSSIANATMQMAAKMLRRSVSDEDIADIIESLKHLPLNEGVQEGLSGFHELGYRIAALTNSAEKIVCERMERTGLVSYFEMVLSAEHIKKYKPCTEVYEWASKKLHSKPGSILMVSAHGWDIAGAANAGMQTAYIRQTKQPLYPLAPRPTYEATHLADLSTQLGVVK
jgi:2-haloacid dehalogenase